MSKQEPSWRNWGDHPIVVIVGILAALIAIAGFITGKSNLQSILPSTHAPSSSPSTSDVSISSTATPQDNRTPQTEQSVRQKFNADGSTHLLTLVPAAIGSISWNGVACREELMFLSPRGDDRWAKFVVQCHEHFSQFYIGIHDSLEDAGNTILSTSQVKDGNKYVLKTDSFRATVTIVQAEIGSDPDSLYPKVFKKLILSLQVIEIPRKK